MKRYWESSKLILFFCLFITSFSSFAQESSMLFTRNGQVYFDGNEGYNYEGSPYFSDDWLKGEVVFKNGEKLENADLILDLYGGKVIQKSEEENGMYLDTSNIDYVLLYKGENEHKFKKIRPQLFLDGREKGAIFYEILPIEGEKLVLEYSIEFINGKDINQGRALLNPDYSNRFVLKKKYFVLLKNGIYNEVKLTNKGVAKVFDDEKVAIKNYIGENNLNAQNYVDLDKVIKFYYSL